MNKSEKKILRKVIYNVAHDNENLWWELKHQIFDFGYQTYYPLQDEFRSAAEHALKSMSVSDQKLLVDEWRKAKPTRAELPDSKIILAYVAMIIEEVVGRARSAAYRTVSW